MTHFKNGAAPWEDGADAKTVNSAQHSIESAPGMRAPCGREPLPRLDVRKGA